MEKIKKKPTVTLISYSVEMTIPIGAYANIKPSIVVKAGSIEEAHNFIAPHMNKLWKEYYLVNERRPEPVKPPVVSPPKTTTTFTPQPGSTVVSAPPVSSESKQVMTVQEVCDKVGGHVIGGELPPGTGPEVAPPDSSVALIKATSAIESCVSLEALDLIQNQVIKSVKLSREDKESLMILIDKKAQELFGPIEQVESIL